MANGKEMNLTTFVERFNKGDFNSPDRSVQCEAGWYDWFCDDSSLQKKTMKLGKKVTGIVNSKRFDKETSYVFFKNWSSNADQFSICDIESGDVMFCVLHYSNRWEVYDATIGFDEPIVNGTWRDVAKYFNF